VTEIFSSMFNVPKTLQVIFYDFRLHYFDLLLEFVLKLTFLAQSDLTKKVVLLCYVSCMYGCNGKLVTRPLPHVRFFPLNEMK